jgi:hypothetical protein
VPREHFYRHVGGDLENERVTVGRYRERIRQAEAMGEFALSETLRAIIVTAGARHRSGRSTGHHRASRNEACQRKK